jgi:hypothetical protein
MIADELCMNTIDGALASIEDYDMATMLSIIPSCDESSENCKLLLSKDESEQFTLVFKWLKENGDLGFKIFDRTLGFLDDVFRKIKSIEKNIEIVKAAYATFDRLDKWRVAPLKDTGLTGPDDVIYYLSRSAIIGDFKILTCIEYVFRTAYYSYMLGSPDLDLDTSAIKYWIPNKCSPELLPGDPRKGALQPCDLNFAYAMEMHNLEWLAKWVTSFANDPGNTDLIDKPLLVNFFNDIDAFKEENDPDKLAKLYRAFFGANWMYSRCCEEAMRFAVLYCIEVFVQHYNKDSFDPDDIDIDMIAQSAVDSAFDCAEFDQDYEIYANDNLRYAANDDNVQDVAPDSPLIFLINDELTNRLKPIANIFKAKADTSVAS